MGYTGISWGSGLILGPVVGGAFAQNPGATWRWAFYINLVLFGVFGPIFVFLLPSSSSSSSSNITSSPVSPSRAAAAVAASSSAAAPNEEHTAKRSPTTPPKALTALKAIDWLGVVLELGGSLSGIMAVSFGGVVYPWSSGRTVALFVVAGLVLAAFVGQQHFAFLTTKTQRILPLGLFRSKGMVLVWLLIVFPSCAVLVPIYYIPLLFRFAHGDSPIEAAVRLLPVILTFVVFAVVGGAFVSRTGWFYPWFLGGSLLIVLGSSLLYADASALTTPASKIYAYSSLIGIGAGSIGQLSYSIAPFKLVVVPTPSSSSSSSDHSPSAKPTTTTSSESSSASDATGLICTGQYLGITLGLTISGAVFQNRAFARVAAVIISSSSSSSLPSPDLDAQTAAAVQGLDDDLGVQFDEETRVKLADAVARSIADTWPLVIASGCLAVLCALALGNERFPMGKRGGVGR